ncbi:MAG: hypothetical protein GWP91_06525, partial [Rhodobacterales bacterium]|nr:hypothetical protein [Rhodobacterales bacterium]
MSETTNITAADIDMSNIKLKRHCRGCYTTVGHFDDYYTRTIEEIYPGHECHEDWGTGWALTDNFGNVSMYNLKREAVHWMWEGMGTLPGEARSEVTKTMK